MDGLALLQEIEDLGLLVFSCCWLLYVSAVVVLLGLVLLFSFCCGFLSCCSLVLLSFCLLLLCWYVISLFVFAMFCFVVYYSPLVVVCSPFVSDLCFSFLMALFLTVHDYLPLLALHCLWLLALMQSEECPNLQSFTPDPAPLSPKP